MPIFKIKVRTLRILLLINLNQGIGLKGKKMVLVWHEKASRTALQTSTVTLHNSSGTDTQYDYSQGNCRTMLSIIIKLEQQVVYCKL